MTLTLDHIVVAAPSLEAGVDHVRELTGLEMGPGGEHPLMGTHNRLLRLGADSFLEVIAVNPDAPAPDRPRWFGLDQPVQKPHLAHWVLRCSDMTTMLPDMPGLLGPAIPVTRGDLSWLLTVPEDGRLPLDGAMPSILEWKADPLPPTQMQGGEAELLSLTVQHPDAAWIGAQLAARLIDPRIRFFPGPHFMAADLMIDGQVVRLT